MRRSPRSRVRQGKQHHVGHPHNEQPQADQSIDVKERLADARKILGTDQPVFPDQQGTDGYGPTQK